ncbi:MAG: hypothetical protein F4Z25_06255 [Chloroflexi bacterium]|nr:hypothetical protein [Chloroflexota bacterium]
MAGKPRNYSKYQFKDRSGRIIRSGITRRDPQVRERELQREVNRSGHLEKVGRRTTKQAAREWEDRQQKGTPPGGR